MIRGPFEEIYYGEESMQTGDQIIKLTFKLKDKITRQVIKKYGSTKILGMILNHDKIYDSENFKKHSLMVLDKSGGYNQYYFLDSDSEPKTLMTQNIASHEIFDNVVSYLE